MADKYTFAPMPERPNFPKEETRILQYWEEIDAFRESLRQSEGKKPYVFYDGPPFATGLPHYGHILAGTIKDVVCRHAHQRGYHVERRFGWDCHGVPVEGIIDEKLKIKGRADVMAVGIDKYNEECRSIVTRYTKEWREVVTRFGRWIDFDNDYKTMDLSYMESVWWVFKQLFDKDLVYRAYRVMAFSTALSTPLSNFEVSLNYKDVSDPSIIVEFFRTDKENASILAWTTTPWTLPSNLALCVHPTLPYLRVKRLTDGREWIVGKDRWEWVCASIKQDPEKDFEVLEEVPGEKLKGIPYTPLFKYFQQTARTDKCWRIIVDTYVTTTAGTCVVHQAPAFGEDDYRACLAAEIILKDGSGIVNPVLDNGCFDESVSDFSGQHVKEADKNIKEYLKLHKNLLYNGTEVHSYPHCWRSDTPLIYKAVPTWFVKVENARESLVERNKETHWVPNFVKEKRFHNWLSEARDWCVSRNRYWGTPLPLWVSDDFEEIVCIGSIEELEKYGGQKVTDLHRHFIDNITIPSKQGKGTLRRIEEVFDCWFESGSMPYAQKHYPFENRDEFETTFPADFIAEGLDQTRGWFYTLMVLSTHLFNKPAWKNIIVNGLVLAADGKKMSKRLQNYPDPANMCNQYGADAVRMYLCNSPVVRAEPLKFKEEGVRDVVKDVFLPWYNAVRFLVQEVTRYESGGQKFRPDAERAKASASIMDKWIMAANNNLIKFVREEMDAYRLYTVVGALTKLLEDLTNWYVRLNRDRMRGSNGPGEVLPALCALYDVLLDLTILLAPITPFITELLYQNLARALPDGHPLKAKSVHFLMIPSCDKTALHPEIQRSIERMQQVVELGRTARDQKKISLKTPIRSITVYNTDPQFMTDIEALHLHIQEELNVVEIAQKTDTDKIFLVGTLNFKLLGPRLGSDMKLVQEAAKELTQHELLGYEQSGSITIAGHAIEGEEMSLARKVKDLNDPNLHSNGNSETLVVLDCTPDPDLMCIAAARDVVNRVQKLRKEAKLNPHDPVDMWAKIEPATPESRLRQALEVKGDFIDKLLRRKLLNGSHRQGHEVVIKQQEYSVDGDKLCIELTVRTAHFNSVALADLAGGNEEVEFIFRQFLQTFAWERLAAKCQEDKVVTVVVKGTVYKLVRGVHFAVGPEEVTWPGPTQIA